MTGPDPMDVDGRPWMVEFYREDGTLLLECVASNNGTMRDTVADALTRVRNETSGPYHMRLRDFSNQVFEDDAAFDRLGLPRVKLEGVAGGGPEWRP